MGNDARIGNQLRVFVNLTQGGSGRWMVIAVLGSIVLAALDTLGVMAMMPLMAVFSSTGELSGMVKIVSNLTGAATRGELILVFSGFAAIVFILKSACTIPFRWWLVGRTTRVAADAGSELMRRYILAPYEAHRMRNVSEVYRNVNDATAQAASVLLGVVGLVSDGLILIAITSVLLVVSPIVTISTIAFFALLMLGTQWLLRAKQESLGEEIAEQRLLGWQFLMPAFDGFRESRLSSSGGKFVDGYREARRKGANAQRALSVYSELPKYLLEIGFIVAIVGIASTLLGTSGEENALTVLAVFTAASLRALPTLNRIAATFAIIRGNQAGLRIISEATADLAEDVEHQEVPLTDSRYAGDIVLRDVSYRFLDGSVDSIRQIDLKIEENQSTAIVGASGAGKSTLLDIILGLLTPTKGTVKVGGRDIKDDLSSWYSVLGVVPQDVFILNATIRENIAFGEDRDAIDEARVREVLEMAELSTLVAAMPEGLNTIVGERGARLSGGQRQRIGLARALYRRPRILVLDEATSALDNETEYEISQTLESLKGDLTVIIVAHRLSTVKNVDHLVYLDSGMIVGQGSVAEVQKSVPQFAKLLELGELK